MTEKAEIEMVDHVISDEDALGGFKPGSDGDSAAFQAWVAESQPQEWTLDDELEILPEVIRDAQETYDEAEFAYRQKAATATLLGLQAKLFPDKDGTPNQRIACNDTERQAAIAFATTDQFDMVTTEKRLMAARRELDLLKSNRDMLVLRVKLEIARISNPA